MRDTDSDKPVAFTYDAVANANEDLSHGDKVVDAA